MIDNFFLFVFLCAALVTDGTLQIQQVIVPTQVMSGSNVVLRCLYKDIPDDDDCILDGILREIIGNQNYQINLMYGLLQEGGYPKSNDCVIEIQ